MLLVLLCWLSFKLVRMVLQRSLSERRGHLLLRGCRLNLKEAVKITHFKSFLFDLLLRLLLPLVLSILNVGISLLQFFHVVLILRSGALRVFDHVLCGISSFDIVSLLISEELTLELGISLSHGFNLFSEVWNDSHC